MTTLDCRLTEGDYADADVDADGDVRLMVNCGDRTAVIYARPEDFARFARSVLAGTGEQLDASPVKVGDYVEVTKYRDYDRSTYEGSRGRVTQVDDDSIPYLVDTEAHGELWVMGVRKVPAPATGSPRLVYVEQARKALDGSSPTAADIVRLAELLATAD